MVAVLFRYFSGEPVMRHWFLAALSLAVLLFSAYPSFANPAPPAAVEAIAAGQNHIQVYWNPSPQAVGYVIYRDSIQIASVGADAVEWSDANVAPGMNYSYAVAAVYPDGQTKTSKPYLERSYDKLPDQSKCDVLVVGATSAGVAAAVTASRYGLRVILTEETTRLGGMPVNGLGATDMRKIEHACGFFDEFRANVQKLYGGGNGMAYEPRVAQQAMKEIIWNAPHLLVYRQVRPIKVQVKDNHITSVTEEDTRTGRKVVFYPHIVIDATDCGDVAAWAGAPYKVGREPRTKAEPHAGYIFYDRYTDSLLPGSTGKGDKRIQAYAYLMTVKDYGPDADKTIPKPEGYDPKQYEHAVPFDKSWAVSSGILPDKKFEINQHPQGNDVQGINYDYPDASYKRRREIEQEYKLHALGYLYYIQTVEGKKNIGLSMDDYRDTDNWPPLIYVREARRFLSAHTMNESDISMARDIIRPDAIGIADYPMDSHAVQPKTNWTTPDFGEGEFYLPQHTPWHQTPISLIIPQKINNLLIPMAVSATHVAYGALRLESVRMEFGEAAGVSAYICIHDDLTPDEAPVRQIQAEILKNHAGSPGNFARNGIGSPGPETHPTYLYVFPDVTPQTDHFQSIEWLAARGFFPCPAPAHWTASNTMYAQPFRPGDSITWKEAKNMLDILLWRRDQEKGSPWDMSIAPGVKAGQSIQIPDGKENTPMSRAECAVAISNLMGWKAHTDSHHYADLALGTPAERGAEAFYATGITSILWDNAAAINSDHQLLFRSESALTRAQFAQILFLAHQYIGPLWQDYAADRNPYPPVHFPICAKPR
jgi:hypothetical protein